MTTQLLTPTATVTINGAAAKLDSGDVTLDASWSPYGQAQLVLAMNSPTSGEAIDPRLGHRAVVTGTVDGITRTFRMGVRSRVIDYKAREVRCTLATDEAILQDYTLLEPYVNHSQGDLRFIINSVLRKVLGVPPGGGLTNWLEENGVTADVTPYFQLRNLFPDPSATDILNYTPGANTSGLVTATAIPGAQGASSLRFTATGAGTANLTFGTDAKGYVQVVPGTTYTVRAQGRSNQNGRPMQLVQRYYNAQGKQIGANYSSQAPVTSGKIDWDTYLEVMQTAPSGATYMAPFLSVTGNAAGDQHYVDAIIIYERVEGVYIPWFSGSLPSAGYTAYWEGAANDSVSVRVPIVERDPDVLVWSIGQNAWDYVESLTVAGQRRLYADEAGKWWLVKPEYTVPGVVNITTGLVIDGSDTISRDGGLDDWATGVAVHYLWTSMRAAGPDGKPVAQARSMWDVYGTPDKVRTVVYNKPFPGTGAAKMILNAMRTRGRTQTVQAPARYDASPNQELHLSLPDAPFTLGQVSAVTFQLLPGVMQVTSKGLSEIPGGTWLATDPAEKWTDPPESTWLGWI